MITVSFLKSLTMIFTRGSRRNYPMLDRNKILSKMNFIRQSKRKLEELKQVERHDFLNNFTCFDSSKYNFIVLIEAMIDICNHIISRQGFEIPDSSADSIKILVKNNILSEEYQATFVAMVKFRNRIVHLYHDVDNEEVYEILQKNLDDVDNFLVDIINYI